MIKIPPPHHMYRLAQVRSDKVLKDTSKVLPKIEDTSNKLKEIKVEKKIKVNMFEWVGGLCKAPRNDRNPIPWVPPSWWKNRSDAEITVSQLMELYDSGINVMMKHSEDDDGNASMLLAVDDRRFNQR